MQHDCYSDILGDGKPLERPFDHGVARVAGSPDSEFGGHAWLGFETFELMHDPASGEWASAGKFVKTPNQVASGKTMQQFKKEQKGEGGKKRPFGS